MTSLGAEQSAPSGAERPLPRMHNGTAYDQVGSTAAIRRIVNEWPQWVESGVRRETGKE